MLPPPQLPIEPPQPIYAMPQNNENIQQSNDWSWATPEMFESLFPSHARWKSGIELGNSNNTNQLTPQTNNESSKYDNYTLASMEKWANHLWLNPDARKDWDRYVKTKFWFDQAAALEDTTGQLAENMGYRRVIHKERPGYETPILQPKFVMPGYNPIENHLIYGNLRKPLETQMKDAYSDYLTQLSKQFYNQYFASPYRPIM
jgi:hypothetical protein